MRPEHPLDAHFTSAPYESEQIARLRAERDQLQRDLARAGRLLDAERASVDEAVKLGQKRVEAMRDLALTAWNESENIATPGLRYDAFCRLMGVK